MEIAKLGEKVKPLKVDYGTPKSSSLENDDWR